MNYQKYLSFESRNSDSITSYESPLTHHPTLCYSRKPHSCSMSVRVLAVSYSASSATHKTHKFSESVHVLMVTVIQIRVESHLTHQPNFCYSQNPQLFHECSSLHCNSDSILSLWVTSYHPLLKNNHTFQTKCLSPAFEQQWLQLALPVTSHSPTHPFLLTKPTDVPNQMSDFSLSKSDSILSYESNLTHHQILRLLHQIQRCLRTSVWVTSLEYDSIFIATLKTTVTHLQNAKTYQKM